MAEATGAESADHRRNALVRLSATKYAYSEGVLSACERIARTDPSDSVREIAIQILAESQWDNATVIMLDLLANLDQPDGTSPRVRLAALRALCYLAGNEAIPDSLRDPVADLSIHSLRTDESRDARIAAALVLERFPRTNVASALIDALSDRDFGVVYHAERSLIRLTGVSHARDADAWRTWLASTDQPFELRGQLDHLYERPRKPPWWQRFSASIKRAFTGRSAESGQS